MNNSAPDPWQTSMGQLGMNQAAASMQQKMNMVNQRTPYGSLKYVADPNSPGGYTATQEFTPEVQALLDANIGNARGAAGAYGDLLNNARSAMTTPLDLSYGANADRIAQIGKRTIDPQWEQRQQQFDATMANRGLMPGSEGYAAASKDFGDQRSRAYDSMFLDAYDKANNAAIQQYNSPFNALAALRGGSQIAQPVQSMGLTTTPQESIQSPDMMGAAYKSAGMRQSQNNAFMGGLFGLGGNLLGAGMKMLPRLMMSDERLKTDVKKVGILDNGLPVYVYRYVWGGPHHIGVMAQDVEAENPGAVQEIGGFKAVDYLSAVRVE